MTAPQLVAARAMPLPDGALIRLMRGRRVEDTIRLGPNQVHAFITHADGSIDDLGISHNLLTTAGRDLLAAANGAPGFGVSATIATASSATSITATATPFVASAYKGWTVVAEESTNAPVTGNIGDNTTSVITVDAWRNADDSAGNTPGSTANYAIYPTARPRFMGLTQDAGAASAADTTLASEITTGGAARALATYAHTGATATYTLQKAFSITATFAAIVKMGLFTASNTTAGGILLFESVFTTASVINGDTLTVTDTVTLS